MAMLNHACRECGQLWFNNSDDKECISCGSGDIQTVSDEMEASDSDHNEADQDWDDEDIDDGDFDEEAS